MITIYKEPGKARKKCPQCPSVYLHARVLVCPQCSFNFKKQKIIELPPAIIEQTTKTQSKGGRGYKQCEQCQQFSSVQVKICPCGTRFTKQKKKNEKILTTVEIKSRRFAELMQVHGMSIILTPAGNCPVKLQFIQKNKVIEWANEVIDIGLRHHKFYSLYALKYFVRYFYNIHSEEYRKVSVILDQWVETLERENLNDK